MQIWNSSHFKKQDNLLDIYLNNVDNAMILLEINDVHGINYIRQKAIKKYSLQSVDMSEYKQDFNLFISDIIIKDMRNLCLYNFYENTMEYDLIKSLNMIRELFSDRGIIIFIMPSIMVERVRLQIPNFYEYIYLRMDYLENYQLPFMPIFSWDGDEFVDKDTLYKRKRMIKSMMGEIKPKNNRKECNRNQKIEEVIRQYYYDLQMYEYKKMFPQDVKKYEEKLLEIQNGIQWISDTQENKNAILDELVLLTARLFLKNHAFNEAKKLYVYRLASSQNNDVKLMESMQEMAYLYYMQGAYEQAMQLLDEMQEKADKINNIPWKCKILNNYAVCLYMKEEYQEAKDILKKCEEILTENQSYNLKREFRVTYNWLLSDTKLQNNLQNLTEKCGNILKKLDIGSYYYLKLSTLTAWIWGIELGNVESGYQMIQQTLILAKNILPENHRDFVTLYYVKALLESHMQKDEESDTTLQKAKKFLSNYEEIPDIWKEI